jgi:hypothetical protein
MEPHTLLVSFDHEWIPRSISLSSSSSSGPPLVTHWRAGPFDTRPDCWSAFYATLYGREDDRANLD